MSHYDFNMPWPPSVNCWKTPYRNRMILTKRGREYREDAIEALCKIGLFGEEIDCRISVKLTLNPPTARKYDIDNFCKSLFDALTHGKFWLDDEQIDRMTVIKGDKVKGGNVNVIVNILDDLGE